MANIRDIGRMLNIGGRILLASLVINAILLTGSMFISSRMSGDPSFGETIKGLLSREFLYYLLIVLISCSVTFAMAILYEKRHQAEVFHVLRTSRFSASMALLFCAVLMVLLIGSVWMAGRTGATRWDLSNPGALFVFVTGWLSVGGVYLTLQQVSDLRHSIVSFQDFIVRTISLIDDTPQDEPVKIMILTPATGCLTLERNLWEKLTDRILGGGKIVQITTLNDETMKKWFERYLDRAVEKAVMKKKIAHGLAVAKNIISELDRKHEPDGPRAYDDNAPILGAWDDIPKTYLIVNSTKAIVCAPLFLPTPDSDPFVHNLRETRVQMIGFESQDFHIVESTHQEINMRRKAILEAAKEAEEGRKETALKLAAEAAKTEKAEKEAARKRVEKATKERERKARRAEEAKKVDETSRSGGLLSGGGDNVVPISPAKDR